MTTKNEMQHVIITGHGRSGTNLVLDLLDASPHTICHNEANAIAGSHLSQLESGFFPSGPFEADSFKRLLNESIYCRSRRDRFLYRHKAFYRRTPLTSAYLYPLQYVRLRPVLHPRRALKEWKLPAMVYNQEALQTSVGVHKILLWPGKLLVAHKSLERLRLIHVIRAPADFLQSWYARYVLTRPGGAERVFEENRASVMRIQSHFGHDMKALYAGGYSLEALLTSEMWRWRYVNELMFDALQGSPRYLLVTYRDVVHRKSEIAKQLTDFCGLEFSERMCNRVEQNENKLFANRNRHPLDPGLVDEISNRVLQNSALNSAFAPVSM